MPSGFFGRQADAIRRGGRAEFGRKVRRHVPRILFAVVAFVPAFIAVLGMRLLRPLILVRTGLLWAFRIGHFVGNTEVYLCTREEDGTRAVDLFGLWGESANTQVERMWRRCLHISAFYREMHRWNRKLPGAAAHLATTELAETHIDWRGVTLRHGPHLSFTAEENARGRRLLHELTGQDAATPFVCIHARDDSYLRQNSPLTDHSYHDYRNSRVESFLDAARFLSERGFSVMRMGSVVDAPLPDTGDPHIIDYATTARSDFMDVWLEANCHFHLGDATGLNEIPRAFRRPVVTVNFIPMLHPCLHAFAPHAIFIPKKLYSEKLGRFWTLREFVEAGVPDDGWLHAETYAELGLTVVANTPAEILAVAREADDRLAGTWFETAEDRDLQARFWEALGDDSGVVLDARVGAAFLRENSELLG